MKKVFLFIAVAFAIASCAPKQAEQEKVMEDSVVVADTVAAPADTTIATIESGPAFQWANEEHSVAFLAHLVSRTGSYLSRVSETKQGGSLAYLIAPPLEAAYGIDAALKAADVKLATYIPAPSETNYSGAFLVGDQAACNAACAAFRDAVVQIAGAPLAW